MPTTFIINKNCKLFNQGALNCDDIRLSQYKKGIEQLLKLNNIEKIDMYLSDNSSFFMKESDYKTELLNKNIKIITNVPNDYGGINKGSGIIENWQYNIPILEKYEYIIHFEPRQYLINNNMIDNFMNNKRNLFTLGRNKQHFNTGLFMIKSNVLINFIKQYTPISLIEKNIGLEYVIFNYIKEYNIQYDLVTKMDLLWYDNYTKKTYEM